eukprot:ANDGO_02081.mRNA.1 hypothetical protein
MADDASNVIARAPNGIETVSVSLDWENEPWDLRQASVSLHGSVGVPPVPSVCVPISFVQNGGKRSFLLGLENSYDVDLFSTFRWLSRVLGFRRTYAVQSVPGMQVSEQFSVVNEVEVPWDAFSDDSMSASCVTRMLLHSDSQQRDPGALEFEATKGTSCAAVVQGYDRIIRYIKLLFRHFPSLLVAHVLRLQFASGMMVQFRLHFESALRKLGSGFLLEKAVRSFYSVHPVHLAASGRVSTTSSSTSKRAHFAVSARHRGFRLESDANFSFKSLRLSKFFRVPILPSKHKLLWDQRLRALQDTWTKDANRVPSLFPPPPSTTHIFGSSLLVSCSRIIRYIIEAQFTILESLIRNGLHMKMLKSEVLLRSCEQISEILSNGLRCRILISPQGKSTLFVMFGCSWLQCRLQLSPSGIRVDGFLFQVVPIFNHVVSFRKEKDVETDDDSMFVCDSS